MDNEPEEVILQQMVETRASLKDKLESLEQQVKETVQGATDAVETVKETVESVKETVGDTVESVKETVGDTVESVKESFNLSKHVQNYPWPAFACATVVGFMGGRLLNQARTGDKQDSAASGKVPDAPPSRHRNSNSGSSTPAAQAEGRGWWDWVADHYKDELNKVKGLAVATVGAVVRDMVTAELAPEFAQRIKDAIDSFTMKLGGEPIKSPILEPASSRSEAQQKTPQHDFGPRWQQLAAKAPYR